MPVVGQGGTANFRSVVRDGQGALSSVDSFVLTLLDEDESIVFTADLDTGIVEESLGHYLYVWSTPVDQEIGDYRAIWAGDLNGAAVGGEEQWSVTAPGTVSFEDDPGAGSYLTPARFRTMRHGAQLGNLSDFDLAEVLADAHAVVDAYCNMPIGGSFLGGVVIGEQRPWRYPTAPYGDTGSRRVWPRFSPIISIEGFRLVVGSEARASLPVDHLVINNAQRWVEVTSASIVGSSGLFGVTGWVVPFGGLEKPVAEIDYTYGTSYAEANERLYVVSGSTYQMKYGHLIGPVTIYDNGTVVDPGEYSLDRLEGRVTFSSPPEGTVSADYAHRLPREIVSASALIAADLLGSSKLISKGMSGVRKLTAGEISIERDVAKEGGLSLDKTLPRAALMLEGFRYWSMA